MSNTWDRSHDVPLLVRLEANAAHALWVATTMSTSEKADMIRVYELCGEVKKRIEEKQRKKE